MKYFNGEEHETDRYRESIRKYQSLEYRVMSELPESVHVLLCNCLTAAMNLLNMIQNFITVCIPTRVLRWYLLIVVSDGRSTRRIHDSRTKSGEWPAGR